MSNKSLRNLLLTVALLLLIPFMAMQFTDEVQWSALDFAVAAVLLLAAGGGCILAVKHIRKTPYRVLTCILIVLAVLLLWAELAVGVLGTALAGDISDH